MKELECDGLDIEKGHESKEAYIKKIHGNIHEHIHHNLKSMNIKI